VCEDHIINFLKSSGFNSSSPIEAGDRLMELVELRSLFASR